MVTVERERMIWAWVATQFLGYVIDAAWHGLLGSAGEPATAGEMLCHLMSVHLPLYVGAVGVLASTGVALWRRRGGTGGGALAVAFGGAGLSVAGEVFHAVSHLNLDTHRAPVAGTVSIAGFLVVLAALLLAPDDTRGRAAKSPGPVHR